MPNDDLRREAIQHFMAIVDGHVSWLEREVKDPRTDKETVAVWRESLKLWKKAQAIGVREAAKLG